MALVGAITLVVGLAFILYVDRVSDRALSYPEIGARPAFGVQFFAGLPATFGYVFGALGLYRFLTNRGPGDESKAPVAVAARVALIVALVALFFGGAFAITQWMRTR
jgi:hypothetical protein